MCTTLIYLESVICLRTALARNCAKHRDTHCMPTGLTLKGKYAMGVYLSGVRLDAFQMVDSTSELNRNIFRKDAQILNKQCVYTKP